MEEEEGKPEGKKPNGILVQEPERFPAACWVVRTGGCRDTEGKGRGIEEGSDI